MNFLRAVSGVCKARKAKGLTTLPFEKEAVGEEIKAIMEEDFFWAGLLSLQAMDTLSDISRFQPPLSKGLRTAVAGWALQLVVNGTPGGDSPPGQGAREAAEEGLRKMLQELLREDPSASHLVGLLERMAYWMQSGRVAVRARAVSLGSSLLRFASSLPSFQEDDVKQNLSALLYQLWRGREVPPEVQALLPKTEETDLAKKLTMLSMEKTIELETAEEEWDPDTPVETLSWEQLKKCLAREIVRAVKVACNNLIESYHKEDSEKIKKGNAEKLDYLEDKTKESFESHVGIEEKEEQETSKDLIKTIIESRIQPSDKKAAKRLKRKKNRRRKGKDAGKNLPKGLKRRKGRSLNKS
ncbi:UNVERIFIED_CONTAM: hypothetical protein K2H54_007716 [Gekko kuhli]